MVMSSAKVSRRSGRGNWPAGRLPKGQAKSRLWLLVSSDRVTLHDNRLGGVAVRSGYVNLLYRTPVDGSKWTLLDSTPNAD